MVERGRGLWRAWQLIAHDPSEDVDNILRLRVIAHVASGPGGGEGQDFLVCFRYPEGDDLGIGHHCGEVPGMLDAFAPGSVEQYDIGVQLVSPGARVGHVRRTDDAHAVLA